MFFDLVLLNRQHRGRMGVAWVAATLGTKKVDKREIVSLNISKLCDNIMRFVASESDSPRSRFSLRLSAILVNGAIRLQFAKADMLLDDLAKILSYISKPLRIQLPLRTQEGDAGFALTPPQPPVKKVTKRKRPVEPDTPQSELDKIMRNIAAQEAPPVVEVAFDTAVLQARAEEITLHETPMIRVEAAPEDFESLGPGLTEGEIADLHMQIGAPPPHPVLRPLQLPSPSTESQEKSPELIQVQAQVHAPADAETPTRLKQKRLRTEPARPAVMEDIVEAAEQPPPVFEVPIEAPEEVTKQTPKQKLKKERKKPSGKENKQLVDLRPPKNVRINRIGPGEVEWAPLHTPSLPQFKLKTPDLSYLIDLYVVRPHREKELGSKPWDDGRESLEIQPQPGVEVTPRQQIPEEKRLLTPIVEEAIQDIAQAETPAATSLKRTLQDLTLEEIMAVAAEKETPAKRRRLLEAEPTLEDFPSEKPPTEMVSHELTTQPSLQPQSDMSVPLPVATEEARQQQIVDQIAKFDRLTVKDVCQRPVNRLNVARAFSDLLTLAKHGYVKLTGDEDGALKHIEKGPKLA